MPGKDPIRFNLFNIFDNLEGYLAGFLFVLEGLRDGLSAGDITPLSVKIRQS